jgi:ABC-type branched-subunit amino acid transport system ATPase component
VTEPAVLLLDEPAAGPTRTNRPSSAHDPLARRGIGVLVVEHDVP